MAHLETFLVEGGEGSQRIINAAFVTVLLDALVDLDHAGRSTAAATTTTTASEPLTRAQPAPSSSRTAPPTHRYGSGRSWQPRGGVHG